MEDPRRATSAYCQRAPGFTLIETLVVLVISVGLVILMAQLFRSVGQSVLALKGGNPEWTAQSQIREQLNQLFLLPGKPVVGGGRQELYFFTWRSNVTGTDGKPALAYFEYRADDRALYYREKPLPAWWAEAPQLSQERSGIESLTPTKIMAGVEDMRFYFVPPGAQSVEREGWQDTWPAGQVPPRLVVATFSRGGRDYTLWFDLRGTDAL